LCPSSETVQLWVNEFKCGKTSIEGASHSVRAAVTPETIDDVHDIVFSVRQASESVRNSRDYGHFNCPSNTIHWRNISQSALSFEGIMLKNKVSYEAKSCCF